MDKNILKLIIMNWKTYFKIYKLENTICHPRYLKAFINFCYFQATHSLIESLHTDIYNQSLEANEVRFYQAEFSNVSTKAIYFPTKGFPIKIFKDNDFKHQLRDPYLWVK